MTSLCDATLGAARLATRGISVIASPTMPASRTFDPLVYSSKSVFLQRVQACVIDGYRHYTSGTATPAAALGLARKFKSVYAVDCDKNSRYRRKQQGLGNARLLLFQNPELLMDFVLLVTPGLHPAHQLERLADIRTQSLAYRELELVQLTLKGRSKPGLTWRLSAEAMEGWRHRLHLATVHCNEAELRQCWNSLYRTLGFGGVRRQVGELVSFWCKEWARYQGNRPCPLEYPHNELQYRGRPSITQDDRGRYWTLAGFPSPAQLPKLFYVRLQSDVGTRLSRLVAELDAERRLSLATAAQTSV